MAVVVSSAFTWWELWPRKKKFAPPPQIPRKHPPGPSPPRPTHPETPPLWDFPLKKNRPPTLPAPRTPPSPPPSRKKKKYTKRPPSLGSL